MEPTPSSFSDNFVSRMSSSVCPTTLPATQKSQRRLLTVVSPAPDYMLMLSSLRTLYLTQEPHFQYTFQGKKNHLKTIIQTWTRRGRTYFAFLRNTLSTRQALSNRSSFTNNGPTLVSIQPKNYSHTHSVSQKPWKCLVSCGGVLRKGQGKAQAIYLFLLYFLLQTLGF